MPSNEGSIPSAFTKINPYTMEHFDLITYAFAGLSVVVFILIARWVIIYQRELRQTKQVLKDGLDINYCEQPSYQS